MASVSFFPKDEKLERKRKYYQDAMERAAAPNPTQVISGVAVKQSPLEGLARALQQGIAGYSLSQLDKQEEQRQQNAQRSLADAMDVYNRQQAGGQTDIGGGEVINWNKVDPKASYSMFQKALMENPDTAPYGLQAAMSGMENQQNMANELEMFKAKMPLELQLAAQKAAASRDSTGGDTGALLDRLVQVGQQSDPSYNLLNALQDLKGGAGQRGKNLADIALGTDAAQARQTGENISNLEYAPQIEAAKITAAADATQNRSDAQAMPILEDMLKNNESTFDAPYLTTLQGPAKIAGNKQQTTAFDLMKQNRLNLAAPLAKALGVNPTDKDFQATLERIVDVNATKQSREAQIKNLMMQIERRKSSNPQGDNQENSYSKEDLEYTAKKYGISIDEVKKRLGQ